MLVYIQRCKNPNYPDSGEKNTAHLKYIASRPGAVKNVENEQLLVGRAGAMKAEGMIRDKEQLAVMLGQLETEDIRVYQLELNLSWHEAMDIDLEYGSAEAWTDYANTKVAALADQLGLDVKILDYVISPPRTPKEGNLPIYIWSRTGDLAKEAMMPDMLAGKAVMGSDDRYLRYFATRPGASHNTETDGEESVSQNEGKDFGLCGKMNGMSSWGEIDDLDQAMQYIKDLGARKTPIYRGILSLREADALAMGFDHRDEWMKFISQNVHIWSKNMNIPIQNFEWCANMHQEKGHPHVHLLYWEKDRGIKDYFVKPSVVNNMRKEMTRVIFREQFEMLYAQRDSAEKTVKEQVARGALGAAMGHHDVELGSIKVPGISEEEIKRIQDEFIATGVTDQAARIFAPRWAEKDLDWVADQLVDIAHSDQLPQKGRLDYGFMPPEIKQQVDALVSDMLNANSQCREAWGSYKAAIGKIANLYSEQDGVYEEAVGKAEKKIYRDFGNAVMNSIKAILQAEKNAATEQEVRLSVRNEALRLFQSLFTIAHKHDRQMSKKYQLLMKEIMENKQARKEWSISQGNAGSNDWGEGRWG